MVSASDSLQQKVSKTVRSTSCNMWFQRITEVEEEVEEGEEGHDIPDIPKQHTKMPRKNSGRVLSPADFQRVRMLRKLLNAQQPKPALTKQMEAGAEDTLKTLEVAAENTRDMAYETISVPGTPGGGKRRPGRPPKDPVTIYAAQAAAPGEPHKIGIPKFPKIIPPVTNINAR
jgi:hypothetical protein